MGAARILRGLGRGLYLAEIVINHTIADLRLSEIRANIANASGELASAINQQPAAQDLAARAADAVVAALQAGGDVPASVQQALADAQAGVLDLSQRIKTLQARISSLEAQRNFLQSALPVGTLVYEIWCADYSLDIPAGTVVGAAEIPGEFASANGVAALHRQRRMPIIRPAYQPQGYTVGDSEWTGDRDGVLMPVATLGPVQTFFNLAVAPWWMVWVQAFRIAQILEIDYEADTCTIKVARERYGMQEQDIPVNKGYPYLELVNVTENGKQVQKLIEKRNQTPDDTYYQVPIVYMECNADAFVPGDWVLARFDSQANGNPYPRPTVIGFETNPRLCCQSGIISIPKSDSAPNGWGLPLTDANAPLGTPGGTNPQTIFKPLGPDYYQVTRFQSKLYGREAWVSKTCEHIVSWPGPRNRHYFLLPHENETGNTELRYSIYLYYNGIKYNTDIGRNLLISPRHILGACHRKIDGQDWIFVITTDNISNETISLWKFMPNDPANPIKITDFSMPRTAKAASVFRFNESGTIASGFGQATSSEAFSGTYPTYPVHCMITVSADGNSAIIEDVTEFDIWNEGLPIEYYSETSNGPAYTYSRIDWSNTNCDGSIDSLSKEYTSGYILIVNNQSSLYFMPNYSRDETQLMRYCFASEWDRDTLKKAYLLQSAQFTEKRISNHSVSFSQSVIHNGTYNVACAPGSALPFATYNRFITTWSTNDVRTDSVESATRRRIVLEFEGNSTVLSDWKQGREVLLNANFNQLSETNDEVSPSAGYASASFNIYSYQLGNYSNEIIGTGTTYSYSMSATLTVIDTYGDTVVSRDEYQAGLPWTWTTYNGFVQNPQYTSNPEYEESDMLGRLPFIACLDIVNENHLRFSHQRKYEIFDGVEHPAGADIDISALPDFIIGYGELFNLPLFAQQTLGYVRDKRGNSMLSYKLIGTDGVSYQYVNRLSGSDPVSLNQSAGNNPRFDFIGVA